MTGLVIGKCTSERVRCCPNLGGVRCPVVTVQSPGDSAISVAQSQRLASGIARCEAVWLSGPTTLDPANTKTVCSLAAELMREP